MTRCKAVSPWPVSPWPVSSWPVSSWPVSSWPVPSWLALAFLISLVIFGAIPVRGHAFAPALLELREQSNGLATVRFKQPAVRAMGSELRPVLPATCHILGASRITEEGTGVVATWEARCSAGLVGQTVAVEGIAGSQADVLLRLKLADGRSVRHVLTADRASFVVPEKESLVDVMVGYGRLGVDHILSGFDHLLFVLGLVLLVGGRRRLLWTVTAFTAGHSVTLAMASLGVVRLPQQPIEALIALSIYVLAVELVRPAEVKKTLLRRSPWWMAGLFGLLHGLGFAGALTEVGLPEGEIPAALFSFNIGIELGQLAFVVAVLAGGSVLRVAAARWSAWNVSGLHVSGLHVSRWWALVPAYGIGVLAAFWFFERALAAS